MKKYNQGVADSNRQRAKHGASRLVDGKRGKNKLYCVWLSMKQRCSNPNSRHYARYGGRGVEVCQQWADAFEVFRDAIGEPPPGTTLDRIDNNKGYEPGNVRWASKKEQANNRSTNIRITWQGQTLTLSEWAETLEYKYGLLMSRWKNGKRGEELFALPIRHRNKAVTFAGETKTLAKWAADSGVPYITIYWRHVHGKDLL